MMGEFGIIRVPCPRNDWIRQEGGKPLNCQVSPSQKESVDAVGMATLSLWLVVAS